MLKLEKTSNFKHLNLRLRERERFFNLRVLKALTLAVLIHSSALILFHVKPFYFSSTYIYPPVQVQFEAPVTTVLTNTMLEIDQEEMLVPPLRLIPDLDETLLFQDFLSISPIQFDPYIFQPLEEQIWPKWQETLLLKVEEPNLQLIISGDLASLSLVKSHPLLMQMGSLASHLSPPSYVTYRVQLDENTGDIFWYERIESSSIAAVNELTEQILLQLRFSLPQVENVGIKGNISFAIFNAEEINHNTK